MIELQPVDLPWLRSIAAFTGVPDDQLDWLNSNSLHYIRGESELLIRPGEPIVGMHIIVRGKVRIYLIQENAKRELATMGDREITGYLPYSRGKVANGWVEFMTDTQMMTLPMERTHDMIRNHFELTQALVHLMSDRVREFTALQQQNEKMMALGKLSAGLAHELNNPAAAIVRDAQLLKKHLQLQPETFKSVIQIQLSSRQVDEVNRLLFQILLEKRIVHLSLRERSRKEEQITDWLDDQRIDNSADLAENFVDFGFTCSDLDAFLAQVPQEFLSPVFNWINSNLVTEKFVEDIRQASERISDLVGSVKTFTHMDRGQDKQLTDIHTGIRNTLVMLGHKIKEGHITLHQEYDEALPQLKAMVGELNQVWTNIIDNALDAMAPHGQGTLTIRTTQNANDVNVQITDDGPGIPAGIITRIFDPFFTTKEIGKGTGMGLEVVQRIIHQHRGSIKVSSRPGFTEFLVCFPLNG